MLCRPGHGAACENSCAAGVSHSIITVSGVIPVQWTLITCLTHSHTQHKRQWGQQPGAPLGAAVGVHGADVGASSERSEESVVSAHVLSVSHTQSSAFTGVSIR